MTLTGTRCTIHKIPSGVFAERRTAAGLYADEMPLVGAAIGVDADVQGLAEAHVGQLRFLEICSDPHVERHYNHDRLRRGRQIAHGCGQSRDAAIGRRAQFRPAKIGIGASLLGDILIVLKEETSSGF